MVAYGVMLDEHKYQDVIRPPRLHSSPVHFPLLTVSYSECP